MNGLIDYKKVYESALKLKGITLERYLENISKWDKVDVEPILIDLEFKDCYFPIPWKEEETFFLVEDVKDAVPQYLIDYFNEASCYSVGWDKAKELKFFKDLGLYTDRNHVYVPYNTPLSESITKKVLYWFRANIKRCAKPVKPIIKASHLLKLAFKVDMNGFVRYYFRDGFIDLDGDGYGRLDDGVWAKCDKLEDNTMYESSGSVWKDIRL